jgi:aminoglycoside phosphotransferase (APT) family kinase protein
MGVGHPNITDLESIGGSIEATFPEMGRARPLRVLGSGFRSVAVETAGGVVVKVGLIPDAADDYAKEWRIGRFLAEHLRGIVPEPRWYAPPCAEFAHGAIAYRKLTGETPAWGADPGAAFARDLGAFMARLHAIPEESARKAGMAEVDSYRRALGARSVVMPVLAGRLDHQAYAQVAAWWNAFETDAGMQTRRVAVCHHDLWHDNLLKSEDGRLSGVLDIAHVEVGDPAHDFAAPHYFGEVRLAEVIDSYRQHGGTYDAGDEHRARRYYQAREFGGLAWAIEHHDADEITDSIDKISRGSVVVDLSP